MLLLPVPRLAVPRLDVHNLPALELVYELLIEPRLGD